MEFEPVYVPVAYLVGAILVMIVVGVVSFAKNLVELWDRLRTKPPLYQQYVSIPDCSRNRGVVTLRIDGMEESIKTLVDEIRQDRKEQAMARRGIHRRVNKVLFGLAQVQGKLGIHNGDLGNETDD